MSRHVAWQLATVMLSCLVARSAHADETMLPRLALMAGFDMKAGSVSTNGDAEAAGMNFLPGPDFGAAAWFDVPITEMLGVGAGSSVLMFGEGTEAELGYDPHAILDLSFVPRLSMPLHDEDDLRELYVRVPLGASVHYAPDPVTHDSFQTEVDTPLGFHVALVGGFLFAGRRSTFGWCFEAGAAYHHVTAREIYDDGRRRTHDDMAYDSLQLFVRAGLLVRFGTFPAKS